MIILKKCLQSKKLPLISLDEGKELVNITLTDTDMQISTFSISEKKELYLAAFDGNIYRLAQRNP